MTQQNAGVVLSAEMEKKPAFDAQPGDTLRHYKGGCYVWIAVALNEADLVPVGVYRTKGGETIWVRPLSVFSDLIDGKPRFVNVSLCARRGAPMTDTAKLAQRLRENCVGHPNARIPWPHRILHEAAALIETQAREIAELRAALVDMGHTLTHIATMDCYTRDGEEEAHLLMMRFAKDAGERHATAIRRAQEPTDGR